MDEMEEHRLAVANLRTKLELLDSDRRVLLRQIASKEIPPERRAAALTQRAQLNHVREEVIRALQDLGEPVDQT